MATLGRDAVTDEELDELEGVCWGCWASIATGQWMQTHLMMGLFPAVLALGICVSLRH